MRLLDGISSFSDILSKIGYGIVMGGNVSKDWL